MHALSFTSLLVPSIDDSLRVQYRLDMLNPSVDDEDIISKELSSYGRVYGEVPCPGGNKDCIYTKYQQSYEIHRNIIDTEEGVILDFSLISFPDQDVSLVDRSLTMTNIYLEVTSNYNFDSV